MAKKSSSNRKKKSESDKVETSEVTEDAIIADAEIVAEDTTDETPIEEVAPVEEPLELKEPISAEEPVAEEEPVEKIPEETKPYEPTPPPPPAPQRQGGFIPLVLGGLIAGIIGYGIATLQRGDNTAELEATIATQSDDISALRDEIAVLAAASQDDGISEQVAAVSQDVSDLSGRIETEFASLDERMTAVEKQPSADGTLQEAAIAAYERDIADLRDQIAVQQEEMRGLLTETREEAQSIEENAIASARSAVARASLAVIQTGLEGGKPFGAALADLEQSVTEPVPDALVAAKDGVATLAQLQADFPDLSRNALATARREGVSGEDEGGLASFMRNQFQVQSVGPQEGDNADAVLSRAQASLNEGRLNDALAELATLPEAARAELSGWIGDAEQRAAALDAAATLASQINVN